MSLTLEKQTKTSTVTGSNLFLKAPKSLPKPLSLFKYLFAELYSEMKQYLESSYLGKLTEAFAER